MISAYSLALNDRKFNADLLFTCYFVMRVKVEEEEEKQEQEVPLFVGPVFSGQK